MFVTTTCFSSSLRQVIRSAPRKHLDSEESLLRKRTDGFCGTFEENVTVGVLENPEAAP